MNAYEHLVMFNLEFYIKKIHLGVNIHSDCFLNDSKIIKFSNN